MISATDSGHKGKVWESLKDRHSRNAREMRRESCSGRKLYTEKRKGRGDRGQVNLHEGEEKATKDDRATKLEQRIGSVGA